MSGMSRKSRLFNYINSEVEAVLNTGRVIKGVFVAYDKNLNLVIADAVEHRTRQWKTGSEEVERELGLVLLLGGSVVSLVISKVLSGKPPESQQQANTRLCLSGDGAGAPAGRATALGRRAQPPMPGRGIATPMGAPPRAVPAAPVPPQMPLPPGMAPPAGMPGYTAGVPTPPVPPGMPPPAGMPYHGEGVLPHYPAGVQGAAAPAPQLYTPFVPVGVPPPGGQVPQYPPQPPPA